MIHATREELHRLRSGALDSSKMLIVSRHVASCPDCGNLALEEIGIGPAARELRAAIGESDEHPDLEAGLFAYVDRTVNEEDRAGIERHLEQCPVCREDVEDAREVRRSIARPRTDEPAKPIQAWTTGDTQRRVGLRRWMQAALAAALTLAVGVTAVWMVRVATTTGQGTAATGEQHPIQSMAVIPMKNVSNSSSDDFLAVAVADALTTRLQKIPSLLVRPTSAVLANSRGANESGLASGAVLGVDCLLQGQYVTTGSLVRVSLQLIDSRTGASLWADRVDGPRDDLLELIEALNLRTVSALDEKLGVQPATRGAEPRSANPKAFEEYLKARALQGSLIPAEFAEQRAHLKRAVELDPNFAAAYADLAIAMSIAEVRGLMDDPHAPQEALGYARKAVSLDPGLAVAHLALGRTIARLPHGFSESAHENLTALRLSALEPAPIGTLGSIFGMTGDLERAKWTADYLARLDPGSSEARTRGYWYINLIDPDDAIRVAPEALAKKSSELAGNDIMANACFLEGNVSEARKYAARASALLPGHFLARSLAAMLAAADGDSGAAKAALQSLEAEARINHFAAMRQALCYAKLGERDEAILWMQRSLDLGNHSWYAWTRHPWMQPLQTDPRFQKIAGAMRADLDKVQPEAVQVYEEIRAKRLQGERWNGRQAGAAPSPRRRGRAVQQHSHVLSECRKAV